jgi:peptidoglycan/xylan/chitin deacetylase (PgdA/CDA1 family)
LRVLPLWKRCLLSGYYHGTYPYRWWRNRIAAAAGQSPAMVLFYHRVADDRANGWTTPFDIFAQQMRWLKSHFDLISLEETQWRIRTQRNPRPSISITFDDGYAENCARALPLLLQERIPCTYFVTTRHFLDQVPFVHVLRIGKPFPPNTLEQLRQMVRDGVEIGHHTRTHADLGHISDPERIFDELVTSRDEMQDALDSTLRYFAFPFGQHANLDRFAYHLAREAGYAGVCSAYGGFNFPNDDAFHLQRIHGDDDMIRLKNWTTVDPRKLRTPRYEFDTDPHRSERENEGRDTQDRLQIENCKFQIAK